MFEFLKELYQDKALTFAQLQQCVLEHNQVVNKPQKIKAINLSEGAYVSIRKYMSVCHKYEALQQELLQKDKNYTEMRMRTLLLEQRLKAYEYMLMVHKDELV